MPAIHEVVILHPLLRLLVVTSLLGRHLCPGVIRVPPLFIGLDVVGQPHS